MSVSETIWKQRGGSRFDAMTGAKNFVVGSQYLQFDIPARATVNRASRCVVTLKPDDTYEIRFYYWNRKELGLEFISCDEGVYCDNLQAVFTVRTGLHTHL